MQEINQGTIMKTSIQGTITGHTKKKGIKSYKQERN
jgi:hypothetical protein